VSSERRLDGAREAEAPARPAPEKLERLAELVRERQPCVVLTGAGISTESGIPDFRSPTGIWAQYDPMEYATIDAFLADPEKVWDFYGKRLNVLRDAEPNEGHRALVELEERGWVRAVITQNIDRLHERAGSRDVVEVHGSIRTSSCLDCGTVVPFDEVVRLLPVPHCPGCGRVLKPDVVMFGELLPEDAIARATQLAADAGLLLVVGSSLEVYPVAGLPAETLAAGGSLAIVNRAPTQFDRRASVTIDAGAGETLRALAHVLPERG
jgi:NAD-dependent deacetylase